MTAPYVEPTGNPAAPYRAVHQRHDMSGWDKQDYADQGSAEAAANALAASGGHTPTQPQPRPQPQPYPQQQPYPGAPPAPPATGAPSTDPAVQAANLRLQLQQLAWQIAQGMAGLTGTVPQMTRNDALDRIWEERPDLAQFFRNNSDFDISTPDGRRRAVYHWMNNVANPDERARWGGDPLKVLQDMGIDTGGGQNILTEQWNRQFGEGQRQFDTRLGEDQRQFNQGQQQRWAQTLGGLSGPRDWIKYGLLQQGIPADQRIQGQLGELFSRQGPAFGAMTPDPGNSWESALADWAANGMQLPGEAGQKAPRTPPTPGPWEGDPDQGRPGKTIPIGGTGTTGTTGGTGTGTGTTGDAAPSTPTTPYVPYPGDSASDDQILLWLYSVRPDIKQVYDGPAGWGGIPDPLTRMRDWWEHGAVTSGDRGGRDLRTYAQQFAAANVRPQSTGGGFAPSPGGTSGSLTMGTAPDLRQPEWDPQAPWNKARTGTRMPWETAPQQGQPGGTPGTLGQATMPRGYDQPSFGEGEPSPSGGPGQKQENPFSLKNLPFRQPISYTAREYSKMPEWKKQLQEGAWSAQGLDVNDAWNRMRKSWVSSGGVASGTRYR